MSQNLCSCLGIDTLLPTAPTYSRAQLSISRIAGAPFPPFLPPSSALLPRTHSARVANPFSPSLKQALGWSEEAKNNWDQEKVTRELATRGECVRGNKALLKKGLRLFLKMKAARGNLHLSREPQNHVAHTMRVVIMAYHLIRVFMVGLRYNLLQSPCLSCSQKGPV